MRTRFSRAAACLVVLLVGSIACRLTPAAPVEPLPPGTGTAELPSPLAATASSGDSLSQSEGWIRATLALRSVRMALEPVYADGKSAPVRVEVDAAGNIHLTHPFSLPEKLAATPDLEPPAAFELFIVNGVTYSRAGADEPVTPDPAYITLLEDLLFGPEGPGLWLAFVPEDGFSESASGPYGGFTCKQYAVEALVDVHRLTGMIWIDEATSALVGADLSIPEGLFYPPGSGLSGDVRINFQVEQADIPPITLP